MKTVYAVAAALCIATGPAVAQTGTPLEKYQSDAEYHLMLCSLTWMKVQAEAARAAAEGRQGADASEFNDCITKGKRAVKTSFDQAIQSIKKRGAQDALKSYHASFVTAFEGIRPGWDERQISYEQRQQALRDKLNEAWARFEIEQ